jgi:hypothetical protein
MYFPHAFRKSYIPAVSAGSLSLASSGSTAALSAGQLGVFNAQSFAALTSGAATPFIIAQGSYFAADKIGPVHGGYQESIKSKVINPKYISRVMKVAGKSAQNQVVSVSAAVGCDIVCDKTYRLRLDIKGSPALRFLSHNLYRTLDAYTGCCAVDGTPNLVDPASVLLSWKDQINDWPLMKDFVQAKVFKMSTASVAINPTAGSATIVVANADAASFQAGEKVVHASLAGNSIVVSVGAADSAGAGNANIVLSKAAISSTDGNAKIYSEISSASYVAASGAAIDSVDAHLDIAVSYVDSKFGAATFTPTDFYELEPLFVYPSFVDESGEPCEVKCFSSAEIQAPRQASGLGESVLRDLILSSRYAQNAYPDSGRVESFRMREIETDPKIQELSSVANRNSLFDQVMILHSVPRFNNPTGTFDNDQYLLVIHVPAGTNVSALTDFVVNSASAAGNAVSLESF